MGVETILAAIGAILAGMFAAFLRGKHVQKKKQKVDQIEAIEKANEVDKDVNAEPDPVKRLRDKWQR